jgi:hypothetical protein
MKKDCKCCKPVVVIKKKDVVFYTIQAWAVRIFFSIVIIGGVIVALFGGPK